MDQPRRQEPLSFAGILKMLSSNEKTGILKVVSAEGQVLIHFRQGRIVNVEMPMGRDWLIGQYLVEGEVVSERKLVRALKHAKKKRISPEDALLSKKYVSPDVLKRYMDLYSREVVLPMFGRVGLVCSMLPDPPVENQHLPPISVPFLLKEGERRAREWPLLTKRIPSQSVVYAKDKSFISQVMKDADKAATPLFSDKVDPDLGANERIVYYFVDGRKSVKQLARECGLDMFSTYRALYMLENKFMVRAASAQGSWVEKPGKLLPLAVKLLFYGALLAALAWLGVTRPGLLKIATGERDIDLSALTESIQRLERREARMAVDVVFLEKLRCPESMAEVVDMGLLPEREAALFDLACDPQSGYAIQRIAP
jgi:hypothetical protein